MNKLEYKRTAWSSRAKAVALVGVLSIVAAALGSLIFSGPLFAAGSPPAPSVTSGPANPTNQTSATFTFTDTDLTATFLCSLDGSTFIACTSPKNYAGPLATGNHTFKVKAKDTSGNIGSYTAFTWTIDLTPPAAPSITAKPTNPSGSSSAAFSFTGEAGATFLCKLDGAAYAPCTSPTTYAGPLSDGSHTFSVEAKDAAGNVGPATSYTWTVAVDTTAPTITISFPADGGFYNAAAWNAGCSAGAGICGSASDPSGVAGGAVSILQASSGKYWNGSSFSSATEVFNVATGTTTSGTTYSGIYPLALPPDGSYTVHARAVDNAGNSTPPGSQVSLSFTIDATPPPAPSITSNPTNPTNQTGASFSFTDTEAGVSFLCKLDAGSFGACTSPKVYSALAAGSHTFSVQAKDAAGNVSATTAFTWTIDLTPPAAPSITAKPTNPSNDDSPTFSFTGEAGASFLCKLDAGSFVACSSPQTYAGPLTGGSHTFSVEAKDAAGNIGAATSYTWTIDLTPPPPPAITSNPAALTTSTSASFSFNDAEPGVTFVCQLDIGVFTSCSSPKSYSGLADGSHTFYVKAVDAATNASSATSYTWTVDTTPPPAPSITSSPANPTNQTSASFSFTDADATASFLCSLDGSAFAACTSPKPYAGPLAVGNHTFKVQAKDPIGNVGPYTAFTWTIDLTPPAAPSITAKPTNPSNDDSPTFSFTGEAGASFLCKLDGGSFVACSSPQTYAGPLAEGSHTFSVEAKDAAGNIGPATSYTWTIDLTPPPTPTINSAPANPIDSHDATFTFSDAQPGVTFVCQMDAGAYGACSSPKNYSGLNDGSHTFSVKAVDAAGNLSSPASYTWTVDTTPPPKPTITVQPPNPSFSTTATFQFTDTEAGVTFECKLDGGAWLPCSSPKTYTGLALGDREFKVRAVDAAGNHSGDDVYKWKVKASDGLPFTISGDAISTIYPGGDGSPIDLVFQNPNTGPITVTSATVTVAGTSAGAGCGAANFSITQQLSASPVIPGSSTRSLSQLGVPQSQWPKLAMLDSGNQNACKNATVNLSYAGTATG